jgi:hypothetical protein
MTTATSLVLIAIGAILAFAVSYQVAGMNIQTIGGILIAVGGIGLFISLLTLAGYAPWGDSRGSSGSAQPATTVAPAAGPPANIAPSTTVAPSINIATPAAMAAPPVAPAVNAAPPTNL